MKNLISAIGTMQNKSEIIKLNERIAILEGKNKIKPNKITIGVQLLLFHYLGLLDKLDGTNTQKATLLKNLFKVDGIENIRKLLSSVSSMKKNEFIEPFTQKNLESVIELFEELKMHKQLKEAQTDLQIKL